MILTSDGRRQDALAVAYGRDVPDTEIRADFAHLAGILHAPPPEVRITRKAGIPAAEAKISGLTNWSAGEVNLDPLVDTFKRFGFFRLVCLFLGNFPLQSVESFTRPPLRVEVNRTSPNVVNYQIWVDQRAGVPRSLPSTVQRTGWGWKGYVGVAALSLVVVGAVFLVVMVLLGQRRTAEKSRGN
jgi:hypothetical protein